MMPYLLVLHNWTLVGISIKKAFDTRADESDIADFVDLFLIHTAKLGGPRQRKVVWQALERCESFLSGFAPRLRTSGSA